MSKLKFGETPWDGMSKEQLLREVQRMYQAMISLESVASMMKGPEAGLFWSKRGTGGQALEMSRQIRAAIGCEHGSEGSENVYRAFFRYAIDLLFDHSTGFRIGFGWMICEKDGNMWARVADDPPPTECSVCGRPLRPIEWKDLKPREG